ncbi:MAG: DUF371 domain-containing protein [Nitrososphaerota archaeon]|jgi:hypothetical protein|nr:DUF371 domain-containing protein [Nitrososphaerota archaeon]MDG6942180.1 DUF371 domain-containing protein [Nitrososphaerota archaeon]MDG6942645.1 DUF371 domain-containing protein [Nitrososphaerota archaeon]MDG6948432.1 DUF371 domain-containing protein [Nitrososphaerota archaeon]MDG6950358.1 DUF371 domain-containing protein [Nitrososphaerota archaeon]
MTINEEAAPARGIWGAKEEVKFRGHPLVKSTHPTTFEVTTEEHLTENGDCIIGVGADKGCSGIGEAVKEGLRRSGAKVRIRISVGELTFQTEARGDPRLELSHPHDIVVRRSDFASDRTLALGASAAARDIPRQMVRLLRSPSVTGRLEIEVE